MELEKYFSQSEIDKIRSNSRTFNREFCLAFSGLEGNVISQEALDRCITTGECLAETAPLLFQQTIFSLWISAGEVVRQPC
jgi:hypothetical protein